jgi:hypothetical protein
LRQHDQGDELFGFVIEPLEHEILHSQARRHPISLFRLRHSR